MGFPPEWLYGIGAVVLLAALVWGIAQRRSRNRANDPITEAATREEYEHPENYDATREELKKKVRPS